MPKMTKEVSATPFQDSNVVFIMATQKIRDSEGKVIKEVELSVRELGERVMQKLKEHDTVLVSARGNKNIDRLFPTLRTLNGIAKAWDLKYKYNPDIAEMSYKRVELKVKDKRDSSGKSEVIIHVPEVTFVAHRIEQ